METKDVQISIGTLTLEGNLTVPLDACGLVLFAHGSGSSRFSPRNNQVARFLNDAGLATLLFDLLTAEEDIIDQQTRELRFNIPLLADRLVCATDWLLEQANLQQFSFGYFGSSTGAAAALIAASKRPEVIKAVVSRGGRPDLAADFLAKVQSPTLLLVGELDDVVITLNREAQAQMQAETNLEIVPGATHLFEEPGTLEEVMELASEWFKQYLSIS